MQEGTGILREKSLLTMVGCGTMVKNRKGAGNMILETERLILRQYTWADYEGLYEILSDPETMAHYPKPYDAAGEIGRAHV